MNKLILALFVILTIFSVKAANTYRVTPDAPGGGNGSSWDNPMTINEAVNKVYSLSSHGHIILCKAGVYVPTAKFTLVRNLTIRGGLAGTDDETLDPNGMRTIIDGENNSGLSPILTISAGDPSTFENLEIRNAYLRAFDKSGKGDIKFKNCVFDSCGRNYKSDISSLRGGAGRFIGGDAATIAFENCVFSQNSYEANEAVKVGNGIALAFQKCKIVMIDNCLFVSNGLGRAALKSTPEGKNITGLRGAAIYTESPLTVRNTEFRANTTGIYSGTQGAMGGVVYIKEAKGLSGFTNCLFLANSCEHCYAINQDTKEAGVVVVRSSSTAGVNKDTLDVVNCTFAYNFTDGKITSAGIDVGSYDGTTANIKNTIFYGAKKSRDSEKGRDIWVSSGCTANIDYCLFGADGRENIEKYIAGDGTKIISSHNVFGDPKFARAITAEEIDSIMVNNGSYYGYSADAYENVFSKADVHARNRKLTVDTGDPDSPWDKEPKPNGKRVNLGYYGNTAEALSSSDGMKIFVR